MNEAERAELERLKLLQSRLQQDLSLLSSQLERLEQRLNNPQPEQPPIGIPPPVPGREDSRRDPAPNPLTTPSPATAFARSVPPVISPEPPRQQAAQLKPPALTASSPGSPQKP